MSRIRRTALLSATAALTFAVAAPSALAADSPAPASGAAATDGLLGLPDLPVVSTLPVVGTVLGGTTSSTTVPSIPGLEVLTPILAPVLSGDPAAVLSSLPALPIASDLIAAITGGGTDPISALVPALTGLTNSLPAGGLPADTVPIGSALAPATDLLRQVAAAAAGTPLATALTTLADQVDAAGDNGLAPDLVSVLASTLGSISQTDGIPAPVQGAAGALATALTPQSTTATKPPTTTTTTTTTKPTTTTTTTTTATTAAPKAPVKLGTVSVSSLKVNRAKGTVTVALKCAAGGPVCVTIVTAYRGTSLAGSLPMTLIPAGGTVKKNLKLNSAARKALKKKTTTFKVGALRQGGSVSSKSVTTKLPKKKVTKRSAAKK